MHFRLGQVFISHTSADKPFVRRLATRLKKSHFKVWLDEHDLIAGDPLPGRIGEALEVAKVILVVVSEASVASKWLRYELNIATERMIKGECRVIPIVIDDTEVPPEVRGLLYADCRKGMASGIRSILTALEHESRRAELEGSFSSRIDKLIDETIDGRGHYGTTGYRERDWKVVAMPTPDLDGDEQEAFYDVIPNYRRAWGEAEPLNEDWIAELQRGIGDIQTSFALIVSERPVRFRVDERSTKFPNVSVRRFKWEHINMTYLQLVTVDLSEVQEEKAQKAALREAENMLIECAEYKNAETERLRQSPPSHSKRTGGHRR